MVFSDRDLDDFRESTGAHGLDRLEPRARHDLIRAGKDCELVVFPGAGHGAGSGRYGERRKRDFFVRHWLGVAPPDWNAGLSTETSAD